MAAHNKNESRGKIISMQRWGSDAPTTPAQRRDAFISGQIVVILKDLLESWRLPKAHDQRT